VVNVVSNTLTLLDVDSYQSSTVKTGQHPYGVAISPDARWAYVSNNHAESVSVIDLSNGKTIKTIAVGEFPEGIEYDKATNQVVVANWGSDTVSLIDAQTNTVTSTITSPKLCRSFGQFILEAK
jgi:YVTN family beta-propeller protein